MLMALAVPPVVISVGVLINSPLAVKVVPAFWVKAGKSACIAEYVKAVEAVVVLIPEPEPKVTTNPLMVLVPEVLSVVGIFICWASKDWLVGITLPEFKS